jgi:signal peptidase I
VQCCDVQGRVMVDGKSLNEPYVKPGYDFPLPAGVQACTAADPYRDQRCFAKVTVPNGNLWVMGDHRDDSADSRFHQNDQYHGTVPVSDVRGKAVFKIWPLNRIGGIGSPNPQH